MREDRSLGMRISAEREGHDEESGTRGFGTAQRPAGVEKWWESMMATAPPPHEPDEWDESLKAIMSSLSWNLRFKEAALQRSYRDRREQIVRNFAPVLVIPQLIILVGFILGITRVAGPHPEDADLSFGSGPAVLVDASLFLLRCHGRSAKVRRVALLLHQCFSYLLLVSLWVWFSRKSRTTKHGGDSCFAGGDCLAQALWIMILVAPCLCYTDCRWCCSYLLTDRSLSFCLSASPPLSASCPGSPGTATPLPQGRCGPGSPRP